MLESGGFAKHLPFHSKQDNQSVLRDHVCICHWLTLFSLCKRLLAPESCLNTEIKFLPLTRGYLHIDAVRVVDVASGDYIDVRDLPDIVAVV